jgi:uncharacterized membrane protein YqaE (UPF0057 family)
MVFLGFGYGVRDFEINLVLYVMLWYGIGGFV